ncbi:acyltransferase [Alloalcanivorax xenomutans]|uniref:acyltransferase n=1 Tax=Alloalcanivorax xenomutans TaxID=1094342 RepID=UPI000BE385C0|nr:acyltransferase [Alloalcanivorax xenomutans]
MTPFETYIIRFQRLLSRYRVVKLKVMGATIGSDVQIFRRPIVYHADNLSIGDKVSLNDNFWCNARGGVCIGDDTIIGPNVIIHSANHRYSEPGRLIREQGHTLREVDVGRNVWIGANVTILPGVHISDKVVIAAGAVVNKKIREPGIYAGVPAKKIKDL